MQSGEQDFANEDLLPFRDVEDHVNFTGSAGSTCWVRSIRAWSNPRLR